MDSACAALDATGVSMVGEVGVTCIGPLSAEGAYDLAPNGHQRNRDSAAVVPQYHATSNTPNNARAVCRIAFLPPEKSAVFQLLDVDSPGLDNSKYESRAVHLIDIGGTFPESTQGAQIGFHGALAGETLWMRATLASSLSQSVLCRRMAKLSIHPNIWW
jgi:hypothetical protein